MQHAVLMEKTCMQLQGSTALMSAARSGELAVAKLLLDAGADVNAKASTTHVSWQHGHNSASAATVQTYTLHLHLKHDAVVGCWVLLSGLL